MTIIVTVMRQGEVCPSSTRGTSVIVPPVPVAVVTVAVPGCGWWCIECRTVVSDADTGNGGRMTDVPNVDESVDEGVVNDVTQGGIMTEVRTDVNVNDGKDDPVANDDSGDRC